MSNIFVRQRLTVGMFADNIKLSRKRCELVTAEPHARRIEIMRAHTLYELHANDMMSHEGLSQQDHTVSFYCISVNLQKILLYGKKSVF